MKKHKTKMEYKLWLKHKIMIYSDNENSHLKYFKRAQLSAHKEKCF